MKLEIKPIVLCAVLIGVLILIIALVRGCQVNKGAYSKYKKIDSLNTVLLDAVTKDKKILDSTKKAFNDSLEFERGQKELALAQKDRTEAELDRTLHENKKLVERHKLAKYEDTTATLVSHGFIVDCKDCFSRLETTTNLALKFKSDYSKLQDNWNRQERLYQNQITSIDAERGSFNIKIASLAKQQQEYIDKFKPRRRLYLSWSVLWSPWPIAAGAGLMYQNKRNLIFGAKCYYGHYGTIVETSINYPLSLNLK